MPRTTRKSRAPTTPATIVRTEPCGAISIRFTLSDGSQIDAAVYAETFGDLEAKRTALARALAIAIPPSPA